MINVAELITDPDFCQTITVKRTSLSIANHQQVPSEITLNLVGIITIASDSTSKMLPEANRSDEDIHVYTKVPLFIVGTYNGVDYEADKVVFNGDNYIVQASLNNFQYGYCRATATREKQR